MNSIPGGEQSLTTATAATHVNPTRSRIQSDSTDPPRTEPALETLKPRRFSRRHVQRYLRQLDRVTRHYIHSTLKNAENIDAKTIKEVKELAKNFRVNLRDTFHDAGKGHEFDPSAILPGISSAIIELTEGLHALRGAESPEPAPATPVPLQKPPETPYETTMAADKEAMGLFEYYP